MTKANIMLLHHLLGEFELHIAQPAGDGPGAYKNWNDPRIEKIRAVEYIIEQMKI